MGAFLQPSDIPGVDSTDAAELINELEAHLSLHYPCISADLAPAKLTLLRAIMIPIIRRWDEAGTGLTIVETTGPFSERRSGGGGHVLWGHEVSAMRALCEESLSPPKPQGRFPKPLPVDDLFMRRPGWPPVEC